MGLFDGGGLFGTSRPFGSISGVQFEQEASHTFLLNHTFGGVGVEAVYTVPTGKHLFIGKILGINLDAGASHPIVIKIDGTDTIYRWLIASEDYEFDFAIPLLIRGGQAITAQSAFANSILVIMGWLG